MRNELDNVWSNFGRSRNPSQTDQTVYLEATLREDSEDNFYTGFSGDINSGGLFVATYDVKPTNTAVAVIVRFPDGLNLSVNGSVEWVREYNPLVPDMVPGMGIKLVGFSEEEERTINAYLEHRSAMFYDTTTVPLYSNGYRADSDNHVLVDKMVSIAEEMDLSGIADDHGFARGLTRDIQAYLSNINNQTLASSAQKEADNYPLFRAMVVPSSRSERQFQGGFTRNDNKQRIFISTTRLQPIGTRVKIELTLPGGWQIRSEGIVRWTRRANPALSSVAAPCGLGIVLDKMPPMTWSEATCHLQDDIENLTAEEIIE